MDSTTQLSALGGIGILTPTDLKELKAGTHRVYELMRDGFWHSPDSICLAAGKDGVPAREGLRRMRELRRWFSVKKSRPVGSKRLWVYRLARK